MCLYLKVMFVNLQFKLEFENKHLPARQGRQAGDRERVLALMRLQSSAVRFIYNRLVALVLPLLGEFVVRDFSPLESVIIEGKWQRRASKLVPSNFGGHIPSILGE